MPNETRARGRWPVVAAVLATTFLAAMEVTVVGTAMPTIVGVLGGVELYSWVFTAYLLTTTVTTPLYGKLADLFGRKLTLLTGIGLFLLGSALAGVSGSMVQLVLFRGLQGLGAGAILPVTVTIFGDLFDIEERARYQGLLSGVWGISALVGPALGSAIIAALSWRWVFFVNLPVGVISGLLLLRYLQEQIPANRPRLDWPGATLLAGGVTALLLALALGGSYVPWHHPGLLALLAAGGVCSALFIRIEARSAEPILPLDLLRVPIVGAAAAANIFFGAVLFAVSAYLPLFVQGMVGQGLQVTALVVTSMSIAWSVSATLGARALLRWGYRPASVLGQVLQVAAIGLWLSLGSTWLRMAPAAATAALLVIALIIGSGFGIASTAYIIGVQNAVVWNRRGVATAAIQFVRSLGQTTGGAVLGSILAAMLRRASQGAEPLPGSEAAGLGAGHNSATLDLAGGAAAAVREPLLDALSAVLLVTLAAAALGLFFARRIPPGTPGPQGTATPGESRPQAAATPGDSRP